MRNPEYQQNNRLWNFEVFGLVLCYHNESEPSNKSGIFCALVDFVSSNGVLTALHEYATVYTGISKTVQSEILGCILSVVKEHIIKGSQSSYFVTLLQH